VSKDLNGIILSWNKGAERMFGYTAEEAIGRPITIVIPTALHDQEPLILTRIANGERIDWFETVRQRKDGSQIHVSLTVSPIRDSEGRIVGASKVGRDISDLRRIQERQELLLREMSHRVKNLFAVASGVVALSARGATDPRELAGSVQSRLAALSRAHDLILPHSGGAQRQDAPLGELVNTVLSPYDTANRRITIEGPAVECGPAASSSFALLLHEFATNSVKYGALADPVGQVAITWAEEDGNLLLTWTEDANTETEKSSPTPGFGTILVDATARSLSAEIIRSWQGAGLHIALKVPVERLKA
jgi:PAS domain S-box-containing protein